MQVGCHISVVGLLKDQLILKIVYEKNLSLICRIFSAVYAQNFSRKFVYKCLYESLAISRNTTTEIWQPVWPFIVQNSGYTSFIRHFPGLQQVCHKLLKTALLQLCVNNLRQTRPQSLFEFQFYRDE